MPAKIKLVGPLDHPPHSFDEGFVNTTSRSNNWSKGLSPFIVGPVKLYDGAPCEESKNFENLWQYSKVYPRFADANGDPTPEYFQWARIGFLTARGERYPMGKGAKPLYSWWAGEKLGYVEARKKIYFPLYAEAVQKTEAFKKLLYLYKTLDEITLWDFDIVHNEKENVNYKKLINDSKVTVGHAYILAMLLEGVELSDICA